MNLSLQTVVKAKLDQVQKSPPSLLMSSLEHLSPSRSKNLSPILQASCKQNQVHPLKTRVRPKRRKKSLQWPKRSRIQADSKHRTRNSSSTLSNPTRQPKSKLGTKKHQTLRPSAIPVILIRSSTILPAQEALEVTTAMSQTSAHLQISTLSSTLVASVQALTPTPRTTTITSPLCCPDFRTMPIKTQEETQTSIHCSPPTHRQTQINRKTRGTVTTKRTNTTTLLMTFSI